MFVRMMRARPILIVVVVKYPTTSFETGRARLCPSASQTKEDIDIVLRARDELGGILDMKHGSCERWATDEVWERAVELVHSAMIKFRLIFHHSAYFTSTTQTQNDIKTLFKHGHPFGVEVRARHFSGFFGNDGAILAGIGGIVLPLADIYKEVFYGTRRYAFVYGFPVQSS
ncbi:hypothetical protein BDR04DRAFT_1152862 [Suillus decipiens]|nr:hypothetical protein BDR04DRAFT_1152862 [Suillus decipiens]